MKLKRNEVLISWNAMTFSSEYTKFARNYLYLRRILHFECLNSNKMKADKCRNLEINVFIQDLVFFRTVIFLRKN